MQSYKYFLYVFEPDEERDHYEGTILVKLQLDPEGAYIPFRGPQGKEVYCHRPEEEVIMTICLSMSNEHFLLPSRITEIVRDVFHQSEIYTVKDCGYRMEAGIPAFDSLPHGDCHRIMEYKVLKGGRQLNRGSYCDDDDAALRSLAQMTANRFADHCRKRAPRELTVA